MAAILSRPQYVKQLTDEAHPTTGPVRFLTPVLFLTRKAEWSACRNFTPVLFSWSNQAMGPVRLDTAVHLWFDQIILRIPHGPRVGVVRAPHGNLKCSSYPTGPVRDPQGCRTAPLRARKGIDTTRICKHPARASHVAARGPYTGPVWSPHGLFTGYLWSLNPYGSRKLIMHALKPYGPRTGRHNSYGAARDPYGPREWTYGFCSKQSGNSPRTTRAAPGVWCDGGIRYIQETETRTMAIMIAWYLL